MTIETNKNGGKQSRIEAKISTVPTRGLIEMMKVFTQGAEKYGVENHLLITANESIDHAVLHALNYLQTGDIEELSHATARLVMALDAELREREELQHELKEAANALSDFIDRSESCESEQPKDTDMDEYEQYVHDSTNRLIREFYCPDGRTFESWKNNQNGGTGA